MTADAILGLYSSMGRVAGLALRLQKSVALRELPWADQSLPTDDGPTALHVYDIGNDDAHHDCRGRDDGIEKRCRAHDYSQRRPK